MTDYVVTGLIKRRAELTGEIERTHESLRKLFADLESLDATLLMFAPDFHVEVIKPQGSRRTARSWGLPSPREAPGACFCDPLP